MPELARRMTTWSVELFGFKLTYKNKGSMK